MKPDSNGLEENGLSKTLSTPIQLKAVAEDIENNSREMESIWLMQKNYSLVRISSIRIRQSASVTDVLLMFSFASAES